jgi:5,10-methylene-tetrahydrofolate dehydrogenase/methenyl tetrahydrofolate cyclohydrolase
MSEAEGAKLISGTATASAIRADLKKEVDSLREAGVVPGLCIIRVGERPDSVAYVGMKKKAAEEMGIRFFLEVLPEDVSQDELLAKVSHYNQSTEVDGILVQLPLPGHIDERTILNAISLEKDVDGFHPQNIGALAMKGLKPLAIPATPKGCLELIDRAGVKLDGCRAVVVGRSNIVGLPMSLLLLSRNATVTVCHSRTPPEDMRRICAEADVLVVAAGRARMVKADWVKRGAVVIDCGINSVTEPGAAKSHLVGDVAFDEVRVALGPAGAITPVPGGVGPMTIASLLGNLVAATKRTHHIA